MTQARCVTPLCGVSVLVLLGACSEPPARQAPPPPQVVVQAPTVRPVTIYRTFTGRTESYERAEVRARVEGVLTEVAYDERAELKQGDVMFRIDPAPFAAARDAAAAEAAATAASVRLADTTARKLEKAYETRSVSELQALEARAQHEVASAKLDVANKQLAIRDLDLGYTTVTAPIAGRAMQTDYVVGSLVGSLGAGPLTTVVDNSRIRVWFSVDDRTVLKLLEQRRDPGASKVVELQRDGDPGYDFRGSIDYFEPAVNEATGTLRMRAVFDNADGRLVPGLFVRVRVAAKTLEAATVVPEAALAADQAGRHLLVVGDGDVVERRAVELGALLPEGRVVLSGLDATDRVVVAGLLRARPGVKVSPRTSDDNR
ncbi:MAG: efflux RND transporter periplasmic adaptor subunit [Planctomycetota bacterium]